MRRTAKWRRRRADCVDAGPLGGSGDVPVARKPGTLVFTADDVRARIDDLGDVFQAAANPGTPLPVLDT
jgi:hypothetical protein